MGQSPNEKDKGSWRNDEFARHEVFAQWWWLVPAIGLFVAILLPNIFNLKSKAPAEVIIYAAQDQVYAEPMLREFEKETGIKVKAVYDSEAVKTVGLANRLLAERSHPQCDVFWGNEEMRARQLAAQGVFRETNGWAAFGYRSRRIVINTNFVAAGILPAVEPGFQPGGKSVTGSVSAGGSEVFTLSSAHPGGKMPPSTAGRMPAATSLLELANAIWRGKVALAFPQFGTTATHFHTLKQLWGEERWLAWCRGLAANKPFIVDGNSVVVKQVGRGEAWIGLTDSDDIAAGQRKGLPVAALPLTPSLSPSDGERVEESRVRGEMLLIPNTVAVIRNAPHPANAEKLFEYLQRPEVAERLVQANALESPEGRALRGPSAGDGVSQRSALRQPDWDALLRDLEITTKQLNGIFLR